MLATKYADMSYSHTNKGNKKAVARSGYFFNKMSKLRGINYDKCGKVEMYFNTQLQILQTDLCTCIKQCKMYIYLLNKL